ncbi:MAG: hypothetical protein N4A49_10565 [Marinifilaceae bacterium]|jgi:hypothetical protein|nr:hypothetical protein [Marinifilaceae bacterium]
MNKFYKQANFIFGLLMAGSFILCGTVSLLKGRALIYDEQMSTVYTLIIMAGLFFSNRKLQKQIIDTEKSKFSTYFKDGLLCVLVASVTYAIFIGLMEYFTEYSFREESCKYLVKALEESDQEKDLIKLFKAIYSSMSIPMFAIQSFFVRFIEGTMFAALTAWVTRKRSYNFNKNTNQ